MNECLFSVLILPRKHRRYQNRQFCGSWGRCLAGEVELGTDLKDKWKKWSSLKFFECLPCCQLLCLFQVPQQAREGLNAGLARGEDGRIFFAFFLFLFAVRTTFKNPTFSLRESFKLLGLVEQPPQLSSATWCPFNTVLAMCLKVKTTFVEGQQLLEVPLSESRKRGMSLYYPAAKKHRRGELSTTPSADLQLLQQADVTFSNGSRVLECFWFSFLGGWSTVVRLAPTWCTACQHAALPECQLQCWYL